LKEAVGDTEKTRVERLYVSRGHLEQLKAATREAHPKEACGLLFGYKNGSSLITIECKVLPNVNHSSVRFTIDPMALYNALVDAEKRGLSLVAIFHSHPMNAYPSETDRKFMEFWPVPWLIFSSTRNKFSVFILEKGKYRKIEMQVM